MVLVVTTPTPVVVVGIDDDDGADAPPRAAATDADEVSSIDVVSASALLSADEGPAAAAWPDGAARFVEKDATVSLSCIKDSNILGQKEVHLPFLLLHSSPS